jgi:hypothetical protein
MENLEPLNSETDVPEISEKPSESCETIPPKDEEPNIPKTIEPDVSHSTDEKEEMQEITPENSEVHSLECSESSEAQNRDSDSLRSDSHSNETDERGTSVSSSSVVRINHLRTHNRRRVQNSRQSASSKLSEPVLENRGTDTHFYDGKLFTLLPELEEDIVRASKVSDPDKTLAFAELERVLRDRGGPHIGGIMRSYMAIVTSHRQYGRMKNQNPNYDNDNNLYACDLMYLLYEKIVLQNSTEHLKLLYEQLDDMSSGLCPQGRSTRLFQALVMLKS